jgi:hypothetical protein
MSLEQEVCEITQLPVEVLRGRRLVDYGVEDRMGWAAKRTTTFKEDKVYCLLGIFGVFLSLIYGEGEEHARSRLVEEIERRSNSGVARLQGLSGISVCESGSVPCGKHV